jgi:hypothetical protein
MKEQLEFIVIGAQKAGTTSLFEYLRGHPELYLPPGKEKPFFSHDDIYARGWSEYLSDVFFDAPSEKVWGKATPWYMAGGAMNRSGDAPAPDDAVRVIPGRIQGTVPDTKLVAILRHPVERCISHYRMRLMAGQETRSIDEAIAELLGSDDLEESRRFPERASYVTWGEYGRILSGYYAVFPASQIFVCFTDELEGSPRELLSSLLEFLDVDTGFVPPNMGVRYREGASARRIGWLRSPSQMEKTLVRQPVVRSLWAALPEKRRRRIELRLRELNYRIELWNRRKKEGPQASGTTLDALAEHYEADRMVLEQLIGRSAPWAAGGASNGGEASRVAGAGPLTAG